MTAIASSTGRRDCRESQAAHGHGVEPLSVGRRRPPLADQTHLLSTLHRLRRHQYVGASGSSLAGAVVQDSVYVAQTTAPAPHQVRLEKPGLLLFAGDIVVYPRLLTGRGAKVGCVECSTSDQDRLLWLAIL